jgi:hypothetical protein
MIYLEMPFAQFLPAVLFSWDHELIIQYDEGCKTSDICHQ